MITNIRKKMYAGVRVVVCVRAYVSLYPQYVCPEKYVHVLLFFFLMAHYFIFLIWHGSRGQDRL